MKKYFLMAIMAATTLSFMSCDKKDKEETEDPGQQTEKKIYLSESEATIVLGGEYELAATLSPAASVQIVWTSTNPKIASVDANGVVTGVAEGEATIIASAEGYTDASCAITVVDEWKLFGWNGFAFFDFVDADPTTKDDIDYIITCNDTTEIELSNGAKVHCVLALAYHMIWSEGIEKVTTAEGYYLDGEGFCALVTDPSYLVVDEGQYEGYYINTGLLKVVKASEYDPTKMANVNTTPAAQLVDPAKHYAYLFEEDATEEGITGAVIDYTNFTTEKSVPYVGLMGTGAFQNRGEFYYASNVAWFDYNTTLYGLAFGTDDFIKPYKFGDYKAYYYTLLPEQSAPAKAPRRGNFTVAPKAEKAINNAVVLRASKAQNFKVADAAKKF